jgi:leader peptidase (prepilin peptidase)/N-methyltransferase
MREWMGTLAADGLPWAEAAVVAGFVALGAVVGSFLNVVAHRVPRGESVVFGGSHCPACGAAIRSRDNVPVLGWLLLRGRCRDCAVAISPRYPLVETACAAIVGTVAAVELLSGGRNLPATSAVLVDGGRPGIDMLLLQTNWRLVGLTLFHCGLLVTLLSWALLERDGHPVPRLWFRATVGIVVVAGVLWPWLQPAGLMRPGLAGTAAGGIPGRLAALAVAAASIATGWAVGRGLGGRTVRDGLMVVGAAMGWQAVLQAGLLLLPLRWVWEGLCVLPGVPVPGTAPRGSRREGAFLVVAAVLLTIGCWKGIDGAMGAVWRWLAAT